MTCVMQESKHRKVKLLKPWELFFPCRPKNTKWHELNTLLRNCHIPLAVVHHMSVYMCDTSWRHLGDRKRWLISTSRQVANSHPLKTALSCQVHMWSVLWAARAKHVWLQDVSHMPTHTLSVFVIVCSFDILCHACTFQVQNEWSWHSSQG